MVGSTGCGVDLGRIGDDGLQVLLEPGHHPGERLALLASDAAPEFGAQHGVDVADLDGKVAALGRDGDEPHAPIGGIGLTDDEAPGFELVDDGADRGPPDAEPVGELGLGGRAELGDVAEQAGLREVEAERVQPSVEGRADEPGRGHQRRLDPQPRR